jgi:hypothetical protein
MKKTLIKMGAGPEDIAILAGLSAGSEIIFAEICAELGLQVNVHLPLSESKYIREFVSVGGEDWVDRFHKVCSHPNAIEYYQTEQVGQPKKNTDPYERNNRWALYSSLIRGVSKVSLLAVTNNVSGRSKDRDEYLTQHMVELMRDTGGKVESINTAKYFYDDMESSSTTEKKAAVPSKPKKEAKKSAQKQK